MSASLILTVCIFAALISVVFKYGAVGMLAFLFGVEFAPLCRREPPEIADPAPVSQARVSLRFHRVCEKDQNGRFAPSQG
ncbi:MAG: hypothetical protein ACJA2X_001186 [Halocynthiibacter sp.]|jgi:hypothetical protein